MKTTKAVFVYLIIWISITFGSAAAQETDYHESWVMDKEKSTIEGRMTEWLARLEMITIVNGEELKIELNYQTYNQDFTDVIELTLGGEEVTRDLLGRGESTSRAEWDEYRTSVFVYSKSTFEGDMGTFKFTTEDHFSLSEDGQIMILKRKTESERGTQNHTIIFNKK